MVTTAAMCAANVEPAIALKDVSKRFGATQALDKVSIAIRAGEVHGLVGENGAGKSTLINILGGEIQPDAGEILLHGHHVRWRDPHHASTNGISVVHQELSLCPNLTATENIGLARVAANAAWQLVDRSQMRRDAEVLVQRFGFPRGDLGKQVQQLSLGKRQLVDIAKALATNVGVLVLDEPNSALTADDSIRLFQIIRDFRDQGVAVVYVSHRLEEVLALADCITVMRDGAVVDHGPKDSYSIDQLIRKMVGREIDHLFRRQPVAAPGSREVFAVRLLGDRKLLKDISFAIKQGEIVGVAGLPGSGKDELVECLVGARPFRGQILIGGRARSIRSPEDLLRNGVAIVPSDRRTAGAIQALSLLANIAAANLKKVSRFGVLRWNAMRALASRYVIRFKIKTRSLTQKVATLSGGNQQKVVLARNLAADPKVLLLHEPTRGIDVAAKGEIYQILNELAGDGIGVLIVSSELPELISQCDRILTLHCGRISAEFERSEFREERILAAAMGQTPDPQRSSIL
jgi:ABC-type sugar transport system ATPase subunit